MASTESFVINAIDYRIDLFYNGVGVFQSDHFFFLFFHFLVKTDNIN